MLLWIIAAALTIRVIWFFYMCRDAPVGYEDDRGFHVGEEPTGVEHMQEFGRAMRTAGTPASQVKVTLDPELLPMYRLTGGNQFEINCAEDLNLYAIDVDNDSPKRAKINPDLVRLLATERPPERR